MAKARLYFDGDNTYIEKQARIYKMVDEIGDKIDNIPGVVNNLSSTSETDALSAAMGKELQDQINAMSGNFHFLSSWDCTTGLPGSDPATDPYVYQSGDYYIVSTVAGSGGTNYKPHGSSYTHGVASTAVETQAVQMNDWYVYDGSTWILQPSGGAQIVIDTALSTTSTNPVENRVITQALNNKQDTIANLSAIESGAAAGATALQPGANITQLTNNAGYQTAGDVAAAIVGKQDVLTAGEGIAINNNVITNTGITCLQGSGDISVFEGVDYDLPEGYTAIEYLESTGTQYIDTQLLPTATTGFDVDFTAKSKVIQTNTFGCILGGRKASGDNDFQLTTFMQNANQEQPIGGTIRFGNNTTSLANPYIIKGMRTQVSMIEGVVTSSNYQGTQTITAGTFNDAKNIYLFGLNSNGEFAQSGSGCRIYRAKFYNGNDVIADFVPCEYNNTLGMYDLIGEAFYTNQGTGTFTAGPEVGGCTTVSFTNASGYVTINDVNVKVFNLSSTSDLTTAQAAYNFGASGGVPIIRYSGETFIPHTATFTGGNAPFWAPTTYGNGSSYTTVDAKQLYLYASNGTVTQVNRYGYTSNTLSAGKDYTTPYTPQYDGSPATKKYVDSKLYVGTTAPSSPTAGQLWYDTTNSKLKVYNGSAWEEVGSGGGGGSTTWGNIGGTLSNQTDLQDALDGKQDTLTAGTDLEIITQTGRNLPAGYTELEYIQSSGTQWINTGITGNVSSTRTLKSDVGVRYDTAPTADTCLLGSRDGNVRAYMVYCYMGWCLGYGAQYRWAGNIAAETKYFVTTEYKENSQTFDVNGIRAMTYSDNMPFTTDLNMYLFAINEGGVAKRFQSAKVYYAKIYVNDVLEFDGVPAKRNSDNALGIYDMVTETFFTNQGSGTFTAGPVVQPGTVINFTNDSGYVTAADIPTYTAGTGIAISNNQISSTVLDFTNLTYDSLASDTWSATSSVAFPSTAKVAFITWRAIKGGVIYAAGETIFPRTNGFIKSSFIGGGASSSEFVSGGIMYDYQTGNIVYTKTDGAGSVLIDYAIYFYK